MLFEEALPLFLKADAGVKAQVAARVYPLKMPQKVPLPALTYQKVSGPRLQTQQGPSLANPRIQFSCWGAGYGDAKKTADAVRKALRYFTGGDDFTSTRGLQENEVDVFDDDTGFFGVHIDFVFLHGEA